MNAKVKASNKELFDEVIMRDYVLYAVHVLAVVLTLYPIKAG